MDTLSTVEKATIDGEDNLALTAGAYSVTSSDAAVASVGAPSGYWYCIGQSAGTATLTATRNSDGATAELDVEVTAVAPGTFAIHLGEHSAK